MITFDTRGDTPLSVRLARVVVPLLLFFAYLLGRVYPAAGGRIPAGEALVMGVVLIGLAFTGLIALGDLIAPLTPRVRSRLDSEALEITAVHAPVVTDIDAAIDDAREQSWPRNAGTLLQPAVEQMARDLGYGPHDIAEIVAMVAKDREPIDAAIDDAREQSWPRNTVTVPAALFFGQGRVTGTLPPEPYVQVGAGPDEYIVTIPDDATAPLHLFTHDYAPQHHTPPRGFPAIPVDQFDGRTWTSTGRITGTARTEIAGLTLDSGRHHRNDKD